jgi:hypothetical protein
MATYEEMMAKARELAAAGDTANARRLAQIAVNSRAQGPTVAAQAEAQAPVTQGTMDIMAGTPAQPQNTVLNVAEQLGDGANTGIASTLGMPIDFAAWLVNTELRNRGWSDEFIKDPFLGSASIRRGMDYILPEVPEPQTRAQRFARRVGEEVGASATMLPLAFASPAVRARPLAAAGVEATSAVGSGLGAATANEVAPGSAFADITGALLGGFPAGAAASRAAGLRFTPAQVRGGIDEQRQIASDAYGNVRADTRILPQDSVDDMALGLSARMDAERINPTLQPGSQAILDAILRDSSSPMRIEDMENLRRITQQSLPATASPADRRLSGIMTDEITAYLDNLGDPIADELRTGRTAYRRASAASAIEDAGVRAERRAAVTGSGGNEINATRQNIARIIESPRRARSFTPDELAQMDEVAQGTPGQNIARRLSRFAPSSGGLSAMLGVGGAMASPAVALPIMAVTEGAKALGERSTRKSIESLLQSLAPSRTLKPSDPGMNNVIRALLAGRSIAGQE